MMQKIPPKDKNMTRITTAQYHTIKTRRKLSKEDEARLEK